MDGCTYSIYPHNDWWVQFEARCKSSHNHAADFAMFITFFLSHHFQLNVDEVVVFCFLRDLDRNTECLMNDWPLICITDQYDSLLSSWHVLTGLTTRVVLRQKWAITQKFKHSSDSVAHCVLLILARWINKYRTLQPLFLVPDSLADETGLTPQYILLVHLLQSVFSLG